MFYKPSLELLENRCVPTTFTWGGAGGNTSWYDPANWGGGPPGTVPGPGDSAEIRPPVGVFNPVIQTTVNVGDIHIITGGTLVVMGSLNVNGSVFVDLDGTFQLQGGAATITNGTLNNGGTLVFIQACILTADVISYQNAEINVYPSGGMILGSVENLGSMTVMGPLFVSGDLELHSSSTLAFEFLPNVAGGLSNAQINVGQTATLAGSLSVSVPDGTMMFMKEVITSELRIGTFSSTPNGWTISYSDTGVVASKDGGPIL